MSDAVPTKAQREFLRILLRGPRLQSSCDGDRNTVRKCLSAGWVRPSGHPSIIAEQGRPAAAFDITDAGKAAVARQPQRQGVRAMSRRPRATQRASETMTVVVLTETPSGTFTDEIKMPANTPEEEIEEAARDAFSNRCSYGWHIKDGTHDE